MGFGEDFLLAKKNVSITDVVVMMVAVSVLVFWIIIEYFDLRKRYTSIEKK